jgi:hypothetical protein
VRVGGGQGVPHRVGRSPPAGEDDLVGLPPLALDGDGGALVDVLRQAAAGQRGDVLLEPALDAGGRHLVCLGQMQDDVGDRPSLARRRPGPVGGGQRRQEAAELGKLGGQRLVHVRNGAHGPWLTSAAGRRPRRSGGRTGRRFGRRQPSCVMNWFMSK